MKKIKDVDEIIKNLEELLITDNNSRIKGFKELVYAKSIRRAEFLKGIKGEKSLENIVDFKMKERNIKSTKELAYLIYEIVDILISPISNDKDFFINYINRKIIISINQNSKGIRKNKNSIYDNLANKGELEKHSRYSLVKNIVLPIMGIDMNRKCNKYIEDQKKYEREFKSFIKNRSNSFVNKLTITPAILIYLYLCNKRANKIYHDIYKEILKRNWCDYEFVDLIDFYNDLNEFVLKHVRYNEYLTIGYEIVEDIYKGYRISLIIKEFENRSIEIEDGVKKYKLELYLGILLYLKDIDLSEHKIKEVLDLYTEGDDIKMESCIYESMRYIFVVYNEIHKLIEKSIQSIQSINIEYDESNINKYYEIFKNSMLKSEKYEEVFNGLNISMEFFDHQHISLDEVKLINRNVKKNELFTRKSGTLYLLLGGYLEYRENNY